MCQFQAYWVQASCNQDPGTLTCEHLLALSLHWHMYLIWLSGTDSFCSVASIYMLDW